MTSLYNVHHSHNVCHSLLGIPTVCGGLKDMKILKTTQSGFEGKHVK